MNSLRIKTRDSIKELIEQLPGLAGRCSLYRRDIVERTPAASIFLGKLESEPETMGEWEGIGRDLTIIVDFHLDGQDADAQGDALVVELESKIAQAIEGNTFADGDVTEVSLGSVMYAPTKRGEEKEGDCTAVFVASFHESIALP